jgi:hypothetical protein
VQTGTQQTEDQNARGQKKKSAYLATAFGFLAKSLL